MPPRAPRFSTTIKRVFLDMKMEDWRKNGFFIEYKPRTEHWDKRLNKLVDQAYYVEDNTFDGVFLCGRDVTRVKVVSILEIELEDIPERYGRALCEINGPELMTKGAWAIKCIPTDKEE